MKNLFYMIMWSASIALALGLVLFDGIFPEGVWLISCMALAAFGVIVLSKMDLPVLAKLQRKYSK